MDGSFSKTLRRWQQERHQTSSILDGPILWNETDERLKILAPYHLKDNYFCISLISIKFFYQLLYSGISAIFPFFFTIIFFIVHTCFYCIYMFYRSIWHDDVLPMKTMLF